MDTGIRPLRPGGRVGQIGQFRKPPRTPGSRAYRVAAGMAGGLFLLFLLAPVAARRLTDWLWFRELGLERVFFTKIVAQWTLGGATALIAFAVLYINARLALRDRLVEPGSELADGMHPQLMQHLASRLALPATLVLALLLGIGAAQGWLALLRFVYQTPFGVTDPVFGRDIAYYVFTLPVTAGAVALAEVIVLLALFAVVVPIYAARQEVAVRGVTVRRIVVEPFARGHIAVLIALFFVIMAVDVFLVDLPSLLFSRGRLLVGASYVDLRVGLPGLWILGVIALAAAGAVVWGARRGRLVRYAAFAYVAFLAASALLTLAVPALFHRLVVQPNELAIEAPQVVHHIAATRRAWGIDDVEMRTLSGETRLTARDIEANRATIKNVRLWDREPLLQTFGQLQAIRTYYDFVSVDDDRYVIDGEYRQVLLSARELNPAALPTRGFINEHLTFTHGYGVTLGPSNQVSEEGLPVLFIKDVPPVSSVSLKITRPEIYFGELSAEFVIANTRQREFDAPSAQGEGDSYTRYAGKGGVPVSSFWRRVLLAARFGNLNVVLSRDILPESRALYHRSIRERARTALPFLRFDEDPYLVITDAGRLQWILDAYTASDRYPYAQVMPNGTSYMRNSVKVVIDAYDGDVRAYLADPSDPIIKTFARIYPGIFRPLDSLPRDLHAHLRYPGDLFRAQTALYATYHMDDPEAFYHREDQWQIPVSPEPQRTDAFMRHIVMRLPGEPEPEFILMTPYTPRQKDNLAAWMVARNDGPHYGKLVVYRFPRQSLVYGPRQVINRINQDTEVARQITLWDQRGSQVIRGDLLVIPIEQSLIYVQPLYLRAEGGRIPELKRMVVAYENRVVMTESLEQGLAILFGTPAPSATPASAAAPSTPGPPAVAGAPVDAASADLLRRAREHYDRARAAQRSDDWATYGAEMKRLGEVLEELARKAGSP